MSGKGNCYDNSTVESFFKSLKAELVWRRNWQNRREVEIALFEYIDGFYNPRRNHSALGCKSTVAFKQKAASHEHLTGTEPSQVQDEQSPYLNSFPFNVASESAKDLGLARWQLGRRALPDGKYLPQSIRRVPSKFFILVKMSQRRCDCCAQVASRRRARSWRKAQLAPCSAWVLANSRKRQCLKHGIVQQTLLKTCHRPQPDNDI